MALDAELSLSGRCPLHDPEHKRSRLMELVEGVSVALREKRLKALA